MIVAFTAATLLAAGAAVAKPGGGGGGSGLAPSASPKGLGSPGGWTDRPPGFQNSHPGWGVDPKGPPGWTNPNATGRSWTNPGEPPGIGKHAPQEPAPTTVK
jgi:hypothetical protein